MKEKWSLRVIQRPQVASNAVLAYDRHYLLPRGCRKGRRREMAGGQCEMVKRHIQPDSLKTELCIECHVPWGWENETSTATLVVPVKWRRKDLCLPVYWWTTTALRRLQDSVTCKSLWQEHGLKRGIERSSAKHQISYLYSKLNRPRTHPTSWTGWVLPTPSGRGSCPGSRGTCRFLREMLNKETKMLCELEPQAERTGQESSHEHRFPEWAEFKEEEIKLRRKIRNLRSGLESWEKYVEMDTQVSAWRNEYKNTRS